MLMMGATAFFCATQQPYHKRPHTPFSRIVQPFNMASCKHAAAKQLHVETMMQVARQTGLCMRATSLLQLQSALLSQKILTHNPIMSPHATDSLLVQCFRVVCMSDVACHILQLSRRVMREDGVSKTAAPPPPVLTLGLKVDTLVSFLFAELDDIAQWLRPDLLTPLRMQRVSEFLACRTEDLRKRLVMSKEANDAFRLRARLRFHPELAARSNGERGPCEADGWRCTCDTCASWATMTEARWQAFSARVLADFPWFASVLQVEAHYRENLELLRKVPLEKVAKIMDELNMKEKLETAVREVRSQTLERVDCVLADYMSELREAASEADRHGTDVTTEM